jgi:hypothetical protein
VRAEQADADGRHGRGHGVGGRRGGRDFLTDWPAICSHVCSSTGWTWDYVEAELDLPRLLALSEYWRDHPPVHVLVATFLDYKPKARSEVNTPEEIEKFARLMGANLPP